MTTQRQSLIDLMERVEAGMVRTDHRKATWQDCDFEHRGYGYRVNANIARAYNGSLDAAKALHEAVLPCFDVGITTYEDDSFEAFVARPNQVKTYDGVSPYMARAWLIAILKALIAEEDK